MLSDQIITVVVTVIGVAMSLGYYPQAYRIWRTKSSKDASLLAFSIFVVGTSTWLWYGFYKNDVPIIASFLFGAIGAWLVLGLTVY